VNSLLDLVLHGGHSVFVWQQDLVGGAAEVTKHIVPLVVQQDVLHLGQEHRDVYILYTETGSQSVAVRP